MVLSYILILLLAIGVVVNLIGSPRVISTLYYLISFFIGVKIILSGFYLTTTLLIIVFSMVEAFGKGENKSFENSIIKRRETRFIQVGLVAFLFLLVYYLERRFTNTAFTFSTDILNERSVGLVLIIWVSSYLWIVRSSIWKR